MIPFCSSVSYSISVLQLLYLGAQCVSVCSQLLRKSKKKNALKLLDQKQLKIFFTTFLLHYYENISYLIHTTAIGSFFISVFYIFIHICTYVSVCFSTCFFPFFNSVCICTIVHGSKYMQYCIVVLTSLSLSDSNANKGRVTSMSCQSYLIHPVKNSVGHSEPAQCTAVQQQAAAYCCLLACHRHSIRQQGNCKFRVL